MQTCARTTAHAQTRSAPMCWVRCDWTAATPDPHTPAPWKWQALGPTRPHAFGSNCHTSDLPHPGQPRTRIYVPCLNSRVRALAAQIEHKLRRLLWLPRALSAVPPGTACAGAPTTPCLHCTLTAGIQPKRLYPEPPYLPWLCPFHPWSRVSSRAMSPRSKYGPHPC